MITKGLLAAGAAAVMLGATVIVTAGTQAPADEQYWGAIAYSLLDGASGTSAQQVSEADARTAASSIAAMAAGSGCEVVVTVERPKCASLVANESLFSTGVAENLVDAKNSALPPGEPGSEVASTCGFIAGTSPATLAPAASTPASATFTHPHSPAPPFSPAAIPAAPTLR